MGSLSVLRMMMTREPVTAVGAKGHEAESRQCTTQMGQAVSRRCGNKAMPDLSHVHVAIQSYCPLSRAGETMSRPARARSYPLTQ